MKNEDKNYPIFSEPIYNLCDKLFDNKIIYENYIFLAFNMNNCFGSYENLISNIEAKKGRDFLYLNKFIVYCFNNDKKSINYFNNLKNNGINIEIIKGEEEIIIEKIESEEGLSKRTLKPYKKEIKIKCLNDKLTKIFDMYKNKIDIIIANPPYAEQQGTSKTLHYDVAEYMLNKYNEKMIFIMPGQIVTNTSSRFDKLKKKFNMISEIEFKNNPFKNVNVIVDIFTFENHKVDNVLVRGSLCNSLSDIKTFNDFESHFMEQLYNENVKETYYKNTYNPRKAEKDWKIAGENYFNKTTRNYNSESYFVLSAQANGSKLGRGYFLSSKDPKCHYIHGIKELKKYCKKHNVPKVFVEFQTEKEAINYVNAIQRPLIRFGLIKMQDTQFLTERCYQYIPQIDWSDDKTKTDEGILELVGFSNEEAKTFAEYTKNFVNDIDKKYKK